MQRQEDEVRRGLARVLAERGFTEGEIRSAIDSWLYAEYSGKRSHGVGRLSWLLEMVDLGRIIPGSPITVACRGLSCHIQGRKSLGYSAADHAVGLVTALAQRHGVGFATVQDCYPTGCMGQYGEAISAGGLIGLAISQSPPRVAPFGASSAVFGTLGHSLSFPSASGIPYIYDTSIAAVTNGHILAAHKAGSAVPAGVLSSKTGQPATSFDEVIDARNNFVGVIQAAGGAHAHRTSGLAGGLELLASLAKLAPTSDGNAPGTFFMAIDPSLFGDTMAFQAEVASLQHRILSARPEPGKDAVNFAGQRSFAKRKAAQETRLLEISPDVWQQLSGYQGNLHSVEAGLS